MHNIASVCVCVRTCLATRVFVGNLPATGRGWIIIKQASDGGPTTNNQLHDINLGVLDHASPALCVYVLGSVGII